MQKPQSKMDSRCPRKLKQCPKTFCPLAVQRLKALRFANRELTEEEEAKLPGCPWAISSQVNNYCFFNFLQSESDSQLSDIEIAHLTSVSVETVKQTESAALEKLRKDEVFEELAELHASGDMYKEFED